MKLTDIQIQGYSVIDRLEATIDNIKIQNDLGELKGKHAYVMWDDMEKLELILDVLKLYQARQEDK